MLEIMTKIISWGFILGEELVQCFGVAPVEKPSTVHKKATHHDLTLLRWMELSESSYKAEHLRL